MITRTFVYQNRNVYDFFATYHPLISNSEPTNCPVLTFNFLDTSLNPLNNPRVLMLNQLTPSTSKLDIANDVAFTISTRIRANSMNRNIIM